MRKVKNWHLLALLNYLVVVWVLLIMYGQNDKPENKEAETTESFRLEWGVAVRDEERNKPPRALQCAPRR